MVKSFNTTTMKWIAGFLAVIFLQITALKYIEIEVRPNITVQPDIVLLMLFFFGVRNPQNISTITGFFTGLVYDIIGGGIIGLSAFSKTIAGFLTGFVPRIHKLQKISQFLLFLFIVTIIHDLVYNAIYVINTEINYWRLVVVHSLPSSIYTAFVGMIIYYAKK